MKLTDFNYNLPEELIAQTPIQKRDESRLMLLDKNTGEIQHKIFKDIIDYLEPGDCIVKNKDQSYTSKAIWEKGNWSKCRICIIKKYTR